MKPALFLTLEYPPQVGGIAVYLSRLIDCFPLGAVEVLAPPGGDEAHKLDMVSPAPIYRRKLLGRLIRPRWLPALYWTDWLCRQDEKPSCIVVSHLLPMGLVARIMKARRGIPYAVIVHGMDVALALSGSRGKRRQAQKVLADASLVAANSTYTAHLAETLGARKENIVVVRPSPSYPLYYAVDPDKVANVRSWFGLGSEPVVLSAGRLVERKGFDTCIRAVAELKRGGQGVRYVIVGEGPDRARLEKLARTKGVEGQVVFAGAVPDSDLAALYSACDVFAMVPRSLGPDVEGFGIVYLEANLFGKPVIGSRSGGVPDAVLDGKTGLLVDPTKPVEVANAMKMLISDRAMRDSLGQAGRKRVLEEFGWARQGAAFVTMIENLTSGRSQ